MSDDPLSELETDAVELHMRFMALVRAGFTRPEALDLLVEFIRSQE